MAAEQMRVDLQKKSQMMANKANEEMEARKGAELQRYFNGSISGSNCST